MHDFQKCLEWSESQSHEAFWEAAYRAAFPDLVNLMQARGDTISQRNGVDRILHLASGKTLYVDEKKRREVYDDFLLEYLSRDTDGAPGWIEKPLVIDYLAYAFIPSRKVFLFPWLLLQRAWRQNRRNWMHWAKHRENGFDIIIGKNKGYRTRNVAVPKNRLFFAINRASVIEVDVGVVRIDPFCTDPDPFAARSN